MSISSKIVILKLNFYYNFQTGFTNRLVPAVVAPALVAPPGADEFSALPLLLQSSREIVPQKLSSSLRTTVNEEGKIKTKYIYKSITKMYFDVIGIQCAEPGIHYRSST